MFRRLCAAILLAFALPAAAQPSPPQGSQWPFAESDLPPDPAFRYGTLANGLRYIVRANGTPAGQGMVQLWIDAGSVAESEEERGFAHFIEHMAFNGSTRVPEGEMIKLLERAGLAFGADTNASTSFDATVYKLDLPRNDPALLETALMLMRETAGALKFDPAAVEREKGVVLSERRVRDTYQLRNTQDQLQFLYPQARFAQRLPIGTAEALRGAGADGLRDLWRRLYRPDNAAIVVIGEFDPALVEAKIRAHFGDWRASRPAPLPGPGPVDPALAGLTDIYLDPALPERVMISRHGPWLDEPDSIATRRESLLRQVGYGIINRRFQRLTREEQPPFRSAAIGTSDVFEVGRTTTLLVDAAEGEWQPALAAAQAEYRRALQHGFSEAEVAEQVANLRTSLQNTAASAQTRSNRQLMGAALAVLTDDIVPTTPESALARFEEFAPQITPMRALTALDREMVPLRDPLIRFTGRTAPAGGAEALRAAWNDGLLKRVDPFTAAEVSAFAYDRFGEPSAVTADTVEPLLGIRTLRFANGLMLNLKRTELARDQIQVQLNLDGGLLLNTRERPLATGMASVLPVGGLGRHSYDELQSLMAGRSVDFAFDSDDDSFRMSAATTRRDLELQLQLLAAAISDPGYRPQGQAQYRRNIRNFFASRNATPANALSNTVGGILSDRDPRFTLQPEADYLALNFAQLRETIGDRLQRGALELAIVGDFDEAEAIALVGRTLGALPAREGAFQPYEEQRRRSFTADRSPRIVRHEGAPDQALLRMTWPTTDDEDFAEALRLELLERVTRLQLVEKLREELGQTYSPGVSSSQSSTYPGYGTFNVAASVDVSQVDAARAAMLEAVRALAAQPVPDDVLLRARQPLLEAYDNALKTNGGWMRFADRAQSEPERLERFTRGKAMLAAITAEDLRAAAARYLTPEERVEIVVLPKEQ